jgi:hypothetical protein
VICIEYKIKYRPGEIIRIKPISDPHLFNAYCDVKAFRNYLADSGRNTYFLGMGDFFDAIVTVDPRFQKSVAMGSDASLNDALDLGYELLSPYRNRIIGLGIGNHERTVLTKYNIHLMRWLCEKLGGQSKENPEAYPRSLGYSWGITLRLRADEGGGRTLRIRGHHGWGGGGSRTQGYPLTKYSRDMARWDADVYLYGHDHVKITDRIPRMSFTNNRIISRDKLIGVCGTFLKTLSQSDEPTYSEAAGYTPTGMGGLTLCIKPQQSTAKKPLKYWFSDEEDE